ncbi:MAG TPA: pseudouridine synthase [Candidatus Saccharimonadales bacterium]|nr:pseudouridine synthase [Candidatus Saccharimonadales bacterium]
MRINKFVALATGMGRRAADTAITEGRVLVNNELPAFGYEVRTDDVVSLDGQAISADASTVTILLNKPVGYVVSREGQGSKTIYDLLPTEYHSLKPVGRLDKDSSGLLLLTNDGALANELTHPRYTKTKVYEVELDKPLAPLHQQMISDHGIQLEDGPSKLQLEKMDDNKMWRVTMQEGRNRQIRRTFAPLGYTVTKLHRTHFGSYTLGNLKAGAYRITE